MSNLIEGGGLFIDYRNPKKIFQTKNIAEWNEHLTKTNATITGTVPCAICSTPLEVKDFKISSKPVCDSCKKELGGTPKK